jgi:Domain of unknown function (DUF4157)
LNKEDISATTGEPKTPDPAKSDHRSDASFLRLQRTLGNQALQGLFASKGLRAKLRVSQPGDGDEEEADRVAEQVVKRERGPVLQRKCDCGGSCTKCQEEENVIHRSALGPLRWLPLSIQRAEASGGGAGTTKAERDESRHPGGHPQVLVVEDEAPKVEAGQMRKRQFVSLLQTTTCATADAVLEAVGHTTKGCPYIKKWLGHYQEKSAAHLMSALHKYAPETRKARSAHEAIALLNQRVERAALSWAKTGKVSGLPEGIQEEMMGGGGGFLGAVAGFAKSGLGKGLLGFIGGGGGKPEFSFGGGKKKEGSEGEAVQKKANQGGGSGGGEDAAAVKEQLGSGQALDGRVQGAMSSAFGYDFSGVRVHTDTKAGELSTQLNARAFTIGSDVAFAGGEYKPGTLVGDALIAHELAHVVQQGGGKQGGGAQTKSESGSDNSSLEQDADRSAVGAVVSAWTGVKNGLTMIGANAVPRLKSGLKLQRCSHQQQAQRPVTAPQGPRPRLAPVDADAQRIIDLAQDASQPIAQRAVAVVRAIVNQYFPGDAPKISRITYQSGESGLHTTYSGRGSSLTGNIGVGSYFVENTTQRDFARRVGQVAHEIEHIDQQRAGMGGGDRSDEREFLAFYHEATFQELPGTGRIQHAGRVHLLDSALGYYYCLSDDLQRSNTTRRDELVNRRAEEVRRSHRTDLGSAPTACQRQSD